MSTVEELRSRLAPASAEVLESMCFILAEPTAEMGARDREEWMHAVVGFSGPVCGSCGVSMPRRVARQVALDFLGELPDDLALEQVDDLLGEIANMVCGSMLGKRFAEKAFALGKPELVRVDAPSALPVTLRWDEDGVMRSWVLVEDERGSVSAASEPTFPA